MATNPFFYKKQMDTTYINPATSPTTWKNLSDNSGLDGTVTNASFSFGDAGSSYRPFWDFDQDSDFITVSDSADIDFGTGPFTIEWFGRLAGFANVGSSLNSILAKDQLATDPSYGLIMLSNDKIRFDVNNVGGADSDSAATLNTDVHIIGTRDSAGLITLYINGVAQADTETETGDVDNAADLIFGDDSTTTRELNGESEYIRLWNRALSAAEVLTQYNGGSYLAVPAADQWGNQTDITPTGQAWSDSNTEGNSVAGLTETLCTISSVTAAGETPAATHAGTWMVKMALASGSSYCGDSFSTVIGEKYRASGWCYVPAGTGGFTQLRVGTSLNNNDLGSSTYTTRDAWTYVQVEYTATTTTTYISSLNSAPSGNMYVDDVGNVQIGAVAEWRLAHENAFSPFQFPKGRQVPVNFPITPRQIVGIAGSGQAVVDDLGDADERFPINVLRVSSTARTNLLGFLQDSTVNYRKNVFQFVDEDAVDTEVRLWDPFPLDFPRVPGSLFNLSLTVRKEIS